VTIRVREGTPGDDPYIDALGELSAQTSVSPLRNVSKIKPPYRLGACGYLVAVGAARSCSWRSETAPARDF